MRSLEMYVKNRLDVYNGERKKKGRISSEDSTLQEDDYLTSSHRIQNWCDLLPTR